MYAYVNNHKICLLLKEIIMFSVHWAAKYGEISGPWL